MPSNPDPWPHSGFLLAVDPGKLVCGAALFEDGVLYHAALLKAESTAQLAWSVVDWGGKTALFEPDYLVVEGQQVYRFGGSDPNDLLPLAFLAGCVAGRMSRSPLVMPKPREWKGSLKKEVFAARIVDALAPAEKAVLDSVKCAKSLKHNVIDAVGLGLWALGRL